MRVLILSQYFLPQPLANAETIGSIASGLAHRGHEVHVVTPVRPGPSTDGVTVHRAAGYFPANRASVPKRLLEYATFSLSAILTSLRVPRPDVVLVPSPPPTLGVIGVVIGALRRRPVVYNVQDLYPEVALATGAIRARLSLRILRALMRFVYRRCAAVVMIDPYFVEPLQRVEPRAKVRAVRNSIDLAPFEGAVRNEQFLRELEIPPGARVVMYAGNVGRSQDLDSVVEATAGVDAHLVIHGAGAQLERLRSFVQDRGLKHVRFSDYRPREELGAVYASADLHVVPLRPGVAYSSVPSKILSVFAAGRPAVVMAESDSSVATITREAGGGWIVAPGDVRGLIESLEAALDDPAELESRGRRGLEWVREMGVGERCAFDYEVVLQEAVETDRTTESIVTTQPRKCGRSTRSRRRGDRA